MSNQQSSISNLTKDVKKLTIKGRGCMEWLFLLDATASMSPYRDVVVNQLVELVQRMTLQYMDANISIGGIAYRDTKAKSRFDELRFTDVSNAEGMEKVMKWLKGLTFADGGDTPEDVHGGLEKAASLDLGWKSKCRTLIHIADAPGHGRRLCYASPPAKYTDDDEPDFDQDGAELKKLMLRLKNSLQVDTYAFFHVITIDGGKNYKLTQVMVDKMKEACEDPDWIWDFDWSDDAFSKLALEAATLSVVRSKIYSSSSSSSSNGSNKKKDRNKIRDEKEPDWDAIDEEEVTLSKHKAVSSIEKLLDDLKNNRHAQVEEKQKGYLKIARTNFDEGAARLVYYGRYRPVKEKLWTDVVLKEFKDGHAASNKFRSYKAQMETQTVAGFLAEQFNEHISVTPSLSRIPKVDFLDCSLIVRRPNKNMKTAMLMEERVKRVEIRKFNNNDGFVNREDPQPYLQAFSHWTYLVTNRVLMVVDIQGFKLSGGILLTDPAIHFKGETHFNPVSGCTNNYEKGTANFLRTHECGEICSVLKRTMEAFRERQARKNPGAPDAKPSEPGPSKGGAASGSGQDPINKPARCDLDFYDGGSCVKISSLETVTAVKQRTDAMHESMKAHNKCMELLQTEGRVTPDNLCDAIELCFDLRFINRSTRQHWHEVRKLSNEGRHRWNSESYLRSVGKWVAR